jgi:putative hydrolase of the HAD superfamily
MRFEAVLLDVGGVFHLPAHDRIASVLERVGLEVALDQLDQAHYAGVATVDDFTLDDRSVWMAYQRSYARACGAPAERIEEVAEEFYAEFTDSAVWTRVIDGAPDALRALKHVGVKLAIVSNADGSVEAQLRADGICQVGPGPGVPVDAVFDSSVVGFSKPDPRIFQLALEHLGVAPDRAIHVGDIVAADVDGARAAGITPVLMDPYDLHEHVDVLRVKSLHDVVDLIQHAR